MINTSIESMTDLITSDWKKEAKIAKDVSAGMMLLTAIVSSTALYVRHRRAGPAAAKPKKAAQPGA